MKLFDNYGRELDATYTIEPIAEGMILYLESRGGGGKGSSARNSDYGPAFELLLQRLGQYAAVLLDLEVYSSVTQNLPVEDRRINLPSFSLPLDLSSLLEIEKFRHEVGRASADIGRKKDSKGGGNPTKRLRLTLRLPSFQHRSSAELEELLALPSFNEDLWSQVRKSRAKLKLKGMSASAPVGQKETKRIQGSSSRFIRDPEVIAWILNLANGTCEACDNPAPFKDVEGDPFLEVHHLRPLSEGGPDQIDNTAAVCPNCHRRLHHGHDKEDYRRKTILKIQRLSDYPVR